MSALTLAMPVYNGAEHLPRALDALLGQTFGDFRFLISDNCSTDATPQILAEYAARDRRIELVRQERNIGGTENYLSLLRSATTELIMFAAHDDIFAPTTIERCLAGLLADDTAVLCTADVALVHEAGEPVQLRSNLDTGGMDLPARANALLSRFGWYAVYGVARRAALLATVPFTKRYGADVVQTMELLLQGQIRSIKEPLFFYRIPASWNKSASESQLVIDHEAPAADLPYTTMLRDIVARVRRSSCLEAEIEAIFDTIVRTIAFENPAVRGLVAKEAAAAVDLGDPVATLRWVRTLLDIDVRTWPQ